MRRLQLLLFTIFTFVRFYLINIIPYKTTEIFIIKFFNIHEFR